MLHIEYYYCTKWNFHFISVAELQTTPLIRIKKVKPVLLNTKDEMGDIVG